MTDIIFYILLFLSLYVQVFFLVTFLERKKEIKKTEKPLVFPSITLMVPCFNEEKTVEKTIQSILDSDYPKSKLSIIVIDDGSTDNTLSIIQKLESERVKIFHKVNGGKHSALNLGISLAKTELVGCVDADSFVAPDALWKMVKAFEDREVMAVGSSVIVERPKNIWELAQAAEYYMAVYVKKILGILNGLHVVAGALSIFRRSVFESVGPYRSAHQTEDMEIIFRMQARRMKVAQCHDAFCFTVAPNTLGKLYKQRRRWIYGFLNNSFDYRKFLFRPSFGNFSMLTVPSGLISILGVVYLFAVSGVSLARAAVEKTFEISAVGLKTSFFDSFFISTKATIILIILVFAFVFLTVFLGKRLSGQGAGRGPTSVGFDTILFLGLFAIVAPFWLASAIFNTIFRRRFAWR